MKKQTITDKVLKTKLKHPNAKNTQIAEWLGISPAHVANALWHLRKSGRLEGHGVQESKVLASVAETVTKLPASDANSVQIGGDHYKSKAIQPWDFIVSNGMGFLAGNVVKYVTRYKDKGGISDLEKARHYLDKLIETERDQ